MHGWRTLVINEKSSLSVEDMQLTVKGRKTISMPMEQLRQVLITAASSMVDAKVISFAAENHVHMMFCGEKHIPVCELIPIGRHHEAAGAVMDQVEWIQDRKDAVWKKIVEIKLDNQLRLLRETQRMPPPRFMDHALSVLPGDRTNREAVAARMYFSSLFEKEFRRHAADALNSKLNYGYTILCSVFSRILAMHGYHAGIGIHHCSRDNPVNLSYDLMEPFRPLVDRMVYESGQSELDWDMKKRLIALPNAACRLNGSDTTLDEAAAAFSLAALRCVKYGSATLPEVVF